MSCTTLLVGKNASYDGSTMIARNDDSSADGFTPKKFVVISSKEQKRKYKTVISHLEIDLPDNPMSYTAMPNAVNGKGIWAASGINEENIAKIMECGAAGGCMMSGFMQLQTFLRD